MTTAELIQKIRNEIERRMLELARDKYINLHDTLCRTKELHLLLSFLSTLEKSEKPMQEGLEEEISRYLREECSDDDEPSISEVARHFAKWTAEKFAKIIRANLTQIDKNVQSQFEHLYVEITKSKMYGGYND